MKEVVSSVADRNRLFIPLRYLLPEVSRVSNDPTSSHKQFEVKQATVQSNVEATIDRMRTVFSVKSDVLVSVIKQIQQLPHCWSVSEHSIDFMYVQKCFLFAGVKQRVVTRCVAGALALEMAIQSLNSSKPFRNCWRR